MTRYWYARRRISPEPSRIAVPVAWQGIAAIVGPVLGLAAGVVGFVLLTGMHFYFLSLAWLVVWAFGSGAVLIWAVVNKCDPTRTVAQYLAERDA